MLLEKVDKLTAMDIFIILVIVLIVIGIVINLKDNFLTNEKTEIISKGTRVGAINDV